VEFYKAAPTAQPSPVQDPVWIQPDHLQKAQKAPFLCRVEPHKRDDFVPLYTTPPAAPVQEPNYWDVIDPAGNIVASETDAIRGWARIAGSYKPTVEGLLGFHDQGWRVLPKVTPPAAQRQWVGLTDNEIALIHADYPHPQGFARAIEAKLKEKNGM
jgi:hypothetical protein